MPVAAASAAAVAQSGPSSTAANSRSRCESDRDLDVVDERLDVDVVDVVDGDADLFLDRPR
jgi:hypothetical protein